MNTTRTGVAGAGTQTTALAFGGFIPPTTGATELWNGTSWTNNPTGLATARRGPGGAGTQTSALAFGGEAPTGATNITEEWDGPGTAQTKTVTVS
jgi:hypothetical protein